MKKGKEISLTGSQTSSEGLKSCSDEASSLNMCSLTASGLTEAGLVAKALSLSQQSECYSEMGGPPSLIQDTQPPSLMQDSMPSLTLAQSLQGPSETQVQGLRRPSVLDQNKQNAPKTVLKLIVSFVSERSRLSPDQTKGPALRWGGERDATQGPCLDHRQSSSACSCSIG